MQKAANVYLFNSVYCFDKSRRLLKKSDYDHVFQQAKKIATHEYIVLYRDNSLGHARLGLALSKKNLAKAHDRNRIKRLFRESFRTYDLPAVDMIILAKNSIKQMENIEILRKINKTWDKLCGK